ncbi:MAG: orotidine 5'-phosphate decarboxylase / HUMPS family protein [Nitrososphaerota archaeon]
MRFIEIYDKIVENKGSILCVGLDPPVDKFNTPVEKMKFCLEIIEKVSQNCCAIKINENFVRDLSLEQHKEITEKIKENNLISIYDCKIGDITNSAISGMYLIKKMGYDALTVNPILGNLSDITKEAHEVGLGVLALVLPSNPESKNYYRKKMEDGEEFYNYFIIDCMKSGTDGIVIGLGRDINPSEISSIRDRLGDDVIILFPGVGVQGGDLEMAIKHGGNRILINVGRAIILSKDPEKESMEYNDKIMSLREFYEVSNIILKTEGAFNLSKEPIRLSSGKLSNYYIDCRAIYSDPDSRQIIVKSMFRLIKRKMGKERFKVVTTASAGIPLASIIADKFGVGLIYYRADKKEYGLSKKIEGIIKDGDYFVGVDDLTTTGKTALECIKAVREKGGIIDKYFVIFDRLEGASELLAKEGVELYSLANMSDKFKGLIEEHYGKKLP